jgi:hypothetical protein
MVLRPLMEGPPELAHLMAAEWPDLSPRERERAVERAAQEGHRAARWLFAERADGRPGPAPLRASRWARKLGLHAVSAAAVREYAAADTLAVEHDYVDHVIDRCAPERMSWWGGSEPDELRQDPRVCAFCAAYERERRAILRMEPLPTGMADLQLYLWKMKEQEREDARTWYASVRRSYTTPEYAAQQRWTAQSRYRRQQFCTDLAEMLLTAATLRSPVDPPEEANAKQGGKRQFTGMDSMDRIA